MRAHTCTPPARPDYHTCTPARTQTPKASHPQTPAQVPSQASTPSPSPTLFQKQVERAGFEGAPLPPPSLWPCSLRSRVPGGSGARPRPPTWLGERLARRGRGMGSLVSKRSDFNSLN